VEVKKIMHAEALRRGGYIKRDRDKKLTLNPIANEIMTMIQMDNQKDTS